MTLDRDLLDATARVAFAAFLHDLGKLTERAGAHAGDPRIDVHLQLYCPRHDVPGGKPWFSHRHAACTSLAMDALEPHLPPLASGATGPFVARGGGEGDGGDATDSLTNAAASHHRPSTFLQWVVATADRVASGFEREEFERDYNTASERPNYKRTRLYSILEPLRRYDDFRSDDTYRMRYALRPFCPDALFPQPRSIEPVTDAQAEAEYRTLWEGLLGATATIPASHRTQWPLWLDHFDTLWLTYTHAIPAATAGQTIPDVSLYDHSHATAALAAALWRWHHDRDDVGDAAAASMKQRGEDWDEPKFLLIQGDFSGIQRFIFAGGQEGDKRAARLLRGRSFYVSLLTELASLHLLEALALPPTSQVVNAAGKFLVVAPNTADARAAVERVRGELDRWFLEHAFGEAGIGLAVVAASCNDFVRSRGGRSRFAELQSRLFDALELAKLQRFDLAGGAAPATIFADASYPLGPCAYNDHMPADRKPAGEDDPATCALSRDQIAIGEALVRKSRLLILRADADGLRRDGAVTLELPVFGYRVAFVDDEDASGRFGELARSGGLRRAWDFSVPESGDAPLWNGYARRNINGQVAVVSEADLAVPDRYDSADLEDAVVGGVKPLGMLASEDRKRSVDGARWEGVAALMTLKGDVDDLGIAFQRGFVRTRDGDEANAVTFARMAALSRLVNAFFAVWLPHHCRSERLPVYTVFAGGDDFFLIGPWRTQQRLVATMAERFTRFAAGNPLLHFSAGLAMSKPGLPLRHLAESADDELAAAKSRQGKAGIRVFGETVDAARLQGIAAAEDRLHEIVHDLGLSTAFVYGLLELSALAESAAKRPQDNVWMSRLHYRVSRLVDERHRGRDVDKVVKRNEILRLVQDIGERGIGLLKGGYRIALMNQLYSQRRENA